MRCYGLGVGGDAALAEDRDVGTGDAVADAEAGGCGLRRGCEFV